MDEAVPLLSRTRYEDLTPGQRWGPFVEPVGSAACDALRGAIGAGRPGRFAPPGMLPLLTLRCLRRALDGIPPGGVLVHHRFRLLAALTGDRDAEVGVRVAGQDRRRSGLYTTLAFTVHQDGVLAATVDWTIRAP